MRHMHKVILGFLALLLFAYGNETKQKETPSIETLEKRIAKLEANIDLLTPILSDLSNPYDLTSFKRIDSYTGFFFIAIEDIKPYLDGYKVKIKIGNPFLATFQGFSM